MTLSTRFRIWLTCAVGGHDWHYPFKNKRYCERCGRRQKCDWLTQKWWDCNGK